jgi:threonine dehydrogenase-like Zn-dependent dehydrogenase
VPKPPKIDGSLLLKVQMVGLCGSDLNSFRGKNPLVNLPRVPGHEVSATIVEGSKHYPLLVEGLNVTLSPYTSCGACAACRRGRPNACQFNETLGI